MLRGCKSKLRVLQTSIEIIRGRGSVKNSNMSGLTYFLGPSNPAAAEKSTPIPEAVHTSSDEYKKMAKVLCTSSPEYPEPIKCTVNGKIPDWINGWFIRVGPGKFEWGKTSFNHIFDGDCLAHSFHISSGNVQYSSKFLKSNFHIKNEKYNRISTCGFGTWAPPDPCANIFKRLFLYFVPSNTNDNTNVKVVDVNGAAWASTETNNLLKIDPSTLEVTERFKSADLIGNPNRGWLAHPHHDVDKTSYVFSTSNGPSPTYDLVKIPRSSTGESMKGMQIVASLPVHTAMPAYYHSFAMTPNYFILVENPLFVKSLVSVLTMNLLRKSFLDLLQWKPEVGAMIRVIDRRTGKELRRCRANPVFIFHHVNAFEREGDIIIDVCTYPDSSIIKAFYLKNILSGFEGITVPKPRLCRYRLPTHKMTENESDKPLQLDQDIAGRDNEILAEDFELPIINYDHNGKEYSYVYGIQGNAVEATLAKVNVRTREVKSWSPGKMFSASEPYFIQSPSAKFEDDGVVVSAVTAGEDSSSYLVVLDAKSFTEIARAEVPVRLVMGIHGSFWPAKSS